MNNIFGDNNPMHYLLIDFTNFIVKKFIIIPGNTTQETKPS